MIKEDYVSFEIAKLLKEKGFDWDCKQIYDLIRPQSCADGKIYDNFSDKNPNAYNDIVSVPTLQMAMKWLREVHNVLLVVDYEWECNTTPYFFKIYRLGENGKPERIAVKGVSYDKDNNPTEHVVCYRDWERSYDDYSTHEETYEAAIKYCLENLI